MAESGQHDQRYERYDGGSPEAEQLVFERLARELMAVQVKNRRAGGGEIARAFHAKAPLGVENARLRFHDDLPVALRVGFAQPGADYPAVVRLSNASGIRQGDGSPDLRGAAVRVQVSDGESHDLLATSYPVSHASDAREFVAFAKAMAGARSPLRKAFGLFVKLPPAVGLGTAARMRRNVQAATRRTVNSLANEIYWHHPPWARRPLPAPAAADRVAATYAPGEPGGPGVRRDHDLHVAQRGAAPLRAGGGGADPDNGTPIMSKPNLTMAGRTAGSPDNAQDTHFFLVNDSGTTSCAGCRRRRTSRSTKRPWCRGPASRR
ncbi:hypothetical protein [Streptomyces adelaidensis]|uniref:hypothetical protein n=1 Tax=Streptomyces adelaidensis TaxID=2796465 RepID=UPI00355859E0